jgi:hypothetical protein
MAWCWYLRRGQTWRTDCYPAPMTFIPMIRSNGAEEGYGSHRPEPYSGLDVLQYWPYRDHNVLWPPWF